MFLCAWKSCSFQENETTTFYFLWERYWVKKKYLVDLFYFEISLNDRDNLLNTLCCSLPS